MSETKNFALIDATTDEQMASRELQRIKGRHRRILILHELGWSNNKIADFLGVTPSMVSYVVNCTLGRLKGAEIQQRLDDALIKEHARIVNLVPAALDAIESVIEKEEAKDSDKLKAAFGIVDRAGLAARQGIDVRHEHAHLHLTPADVAELHRRGMELVKRAGILVGSEQLEQQKQAEQVLDVEGNGQATDHGGPATGGHATEPTTEPTSSDRSDMQALHEKIKQMVHEPTDDDDRPAVDAITLIRDAAGSSKHSGEELRKALDELVGPGLEYNTVAGGDD